MDYWVIFIRKIVAFFCFLLISIPLWPYEDSQSLVFKNVRIFDGKQLIPTATVIVVDGKIQSIGNQISIPDQAEVIEGDNLTLLPGLIDAHVHIWDEQHLRQFLIFGVTTVIDMYMDVKKMTDIKKKQSAGRISDMASLISAGVAITAPGGHGTQFSIPISTITRPEDAQASVDARIAEGSDFIKTIYDDGSTYSIDFPTLDKETIAAIIKAAHNRNKLAVVHVATLQGARMAVAAGADGLAHIFCEDIFDPGFGAFVARSKAFVIPTLSVLESICRTSGALSLLDDPGLSPYLRPRDIKNLQDKFPFTSQVGKKGYEGALKALRQLQAEKVIILAGTDSPNPGTAYGASLHRELELLVAAGFSPVEALSAATSCPAEVFNLSDRGRIQSGLTADLLLVEGDPTKDIKKIRRITGVWKSGVEVDRTAYLMSVKKEKEAGKNQKKETNPLDLGSGLISDFEADEVISGFGAGWSVSTDKRMGGKSQAEFKQVPEGALGSQGALMVTGTIVKGSPITWAGAFFSPGKTYMAPADLSSKKTLSFWAKGDGKTYTVMIFTKSKGFMPAIQNFDSYSDWQNYKFSFKQFGTAGHDITGIFIGGAREKGEFVLLIDHIILQ